MGELQAVVANSTRDAWAVGLDIGSGRALAEHWDGQRWRAISTSRLSGPSPPAYDDTTELDAVTALDRGHAWAGGAISDHFVDQVIARWDGRAWTQDSAPSLPIRPDNDEERDDNGINGIAALSDRDVWAVGNDQGYSLIEHWNGVRWTVSNNPAFNIPYTYLNGVAAASRTNLWAVGTYFKHLNEPLIEHWNGTRWAVVRGPPVPGLELSDIASSPTQDLWAVGSRTSPYNVGVILRYACP